MFRIAVRRGLHRAPGRMERPHGPWRRCHRTVARSRRNLRRVPTSIVGDVGLTGPVPETAHGPCGRGPRPPRRPRRTRGDVVRFPERRSAIAAFRRREDGSVALTRNTFGCMMVEVGGGFGHRPRAPMNPAQARGIERVRRWSRSRAVTVISKPRSRHRFQDMTAPRGCAEGARNPKGGQPVRWRKRLRRMTGSAASEGSP